jgi:hypothetical protein
MKAFALPLFLLIASTAFGQQKIDPRLKTQLDSVSALDQKYRGTLMLLMNPNTQDSAAKSMSLTVQQATSQYWKLQNYADSTNVVFIEAVFKKYGYPGKSLVGEPTNEAAWYIIQHSRKIGQYMPIMKTAAEKHELPFHLYAMMLDRELMNEGKEQIYGSQGTSMALKNGKNIAWYIWPIKDVAHVNERRKAAGFEQSVEQNAKRLDIDYKVIKIEEVK